MDINETLHSIAEVAVTLVGFAAVFRAFRGQKIDPHSGPRVLGVIEIGLFLVLLCYLPSALLTAGVSDGAVYRGLSGVAALYWIRWVVIALSISRVRQPTPVIYGVFSVLAAALTAAGAANALGALARPGFVYLGIAVATLAQVGLTFLAQFRAESVVAEPSSL